VAGKIEFLQRNLNEPLPEKVDLIIANLPYVKASESKEGLLAREPQRALNGGEDGLDAFRLFCQSVAKCIKQGGCILLEVGQGQAQVVSALLSEAFPGGDSKIYPDLAGIERVVEMRLTQVQ
ncbi:MAG TPA: peptide chain release factor N(5)-glutamine methyltransferase, partial [Dehalococcoidales bacterium]|nr:peptide chain release factor N(5)-glutamine methyltransferase [Dehalococcoidales bacterium]